jgi:hypothetical protein
LYLTTSFARAVKHGFIRKAKQSKQQTRMFMDTILRYFTVTLSIIHPCQHIDNVASYLIFKECRLVSRARE